MANMAGARLRDRLSVARHAHHLVWQRRRSEHAEDIDGRQLQAPASDGGFLERDHSAGGRQRHDTGSRRLEPHIALLERANHDRHERNPAGASGADPADAWQLDEFTVHHRKRDVEHWMGVSVHASPGVGSLVPGPRGSGRWESRQHACRERKWGVGSVGHDANKHREPRARGESACRLRVDRESLGGTVTATGVRPTWCYRSAMGPCS